MYILKWFRFIIAKIYNILQYVIPHKLRHMCNLHIKESEIPQKRSKGIKNWKITYSVILSVLSYKTNLILGFSSSLKIIHFMTIGFMYVSFHCFFVIVVHDCLYTKQLWTANENQLISNRFLVIDITTIIQQKIIHCPFFFSNWQVWVTCHYLEHKRCSTSGNIHFGRGNEWYIC